MGAMTTDRDTEFRIFMAAVWPRLLRTAYLLAGDQHAAEDLAQSAFERAYAAWGRVSRADDPLAYVRRILVNQHARSHRRRPPELLVTAVPESAIPEDGFARSDQRSALLSALAALPPRQRTAVVLRHWEDLSDSQAAAAMGCSVGAVRSQAAKGIARLREVAQLKELQEVGRVGGAV
ncbi:SigE family RNA polymerase sigma factor [Kitasatospora sp. A2-31]|uniref:SigE family RNA polymerase sigma factor n=1 Tax=Kitasatospora sp. A2-31 TaxID=2916414 RepID=UPI001EEC4843|nr:SigE family RNA polymerase sigma factor [Kitasatospora sp. A2-31]MCG6497916.1 SigE family RNA polymerase sigma factor [Kitasatospora sp. A2-31]